MGDFFYYGQKDVIRRLNELAGRGTVVASYAPVVGRSPLGGPNGYMSPAWLDPNLPIYTAVPLAVKAVGKFGYNFLHAGQAQRLYKIATLPRFDIGTYASLRVDAMIGGWVAGTFTAMTIVMGNRDGFSVDWSSSLFVPTGARFVVYLEANGSHSVYLFFLSSAFAQAAFNLQGAGCASYAEPAYTDSVSGTLVWDSGANFGTSSYKSPRSCGTGASAIVSLRNGSSFDGLVEVRALSGSTNASSALYGGAGANATSAGTGVMSLVHGVSGNAGVNYEGRMAWSVSAGNYGSLYALGYRITLNALDFGSNSWTPPLLMISGNGMVYVPILKAGSSDTAQRHHISRGTGQGAEILHIGVDQAQAPSVAVLASEGTFSWAAPTAVLYVGKNSVTGRSIASGGTITGQGSDYAEYFQKCPVCAPVAAGQVIGINNKNQVTDVWADAVMFGIKSTDPSFVGGDSWSKDLGPRPSAKAGNEPVKPVRVPDEMGEESVPGTDPAEYIEVVIKPGDTDAEWEVKMADYDAALAAWHVVVAEDQGAMAAFDTGLEAERQKVDRIAIAGRVPVNVLGAQPGDYIVPVQDGAGIKGIAVQGGDLSMQQYLRAVGRVISIEPDGRAYVMVKAV